MRPLLMLAAAVFLVPLGTATPEGSDAHFQGAGRLDHFFNWFLEVHCGVEAPIVGQIVLTVEQRDQQSALGVLEFVCPAHVAGHAAPVVGAQYALSAVWRLTGNWDTGLSGRCLSPLPGDCWLSIGPYGDGTSIAVEGYYGLATGYGSDFWAHVSDLNIV